MTFAALHALNRLRARRDLDVRLVEYCADGGAVVAVLSLARPVTRRTAADRLVIQPSGEIACDSPGCEAAA